MRTVHIIIMLHSPVADLWGKSGHSRPIQFDCRLTYPSNEEINVRYWKHSIIPPQPNVWIRHCITYANTNFLKYILGSAYTASAISFDFSTTNMQDNKLTLTRLLVVGLYHTCRSVACYVSCSISRTIKLIHEEY